MPRHIRPGLPLSHVPSSFSEGVSAPQPSRAARRQAFRALIRATWPQTVLRVVHGLWAALGAQDSGCPAGVALDLKAPVVLGAYLAGLRLGGRAGLACALGGPRWWAPDHYALMAAPHTGTSAGDPGHTLLADLPVRALQEELALRLAQPVTPARAGPRVQMTFDRAAPAVIAACARPSRSACGAEGFSPARAMAYFELAEARVLHTVEVWDGAGTLLAGLFGLSLGRFFVIAGGRGPADGLRVALTHLMAQADVSLVDLGPLASLPGLAVERDSPEMYQHRVEAVLRAGSRATWDVDGVALAQVVQPTMPWSAAA